LKKIVQRSKVILEINTRSVYISNGTVEMVNEIRIRLIRKVALT